MYTCVYNISVILTYNRYRETKLLKLPTSSESIMHT